MAVDPFTALSLAASVVQFVDFGTRTASKIAELYNSASGFTENQNEILEAAERFEKLAEQLSKISLTNENDTHVIVDHASFHALLLSCKSRARELIAIVNNLKVPKSRALWSSIRQGTRGLLKKDEIEQLVGKMKELHVFLNTYLHALLW
jgi:glutamate/tyrosine decarboxylase-like PLP-dependent enzyme